ncbi:unnamed protein product [Effrenium voratum]|nr:unnamed protein product [Effrenium voratum]
MAWVVAIPSFDRLGSIKSRTLQVLLSSGISATRIYVFADPTQYTQYLKDLQSLGIHVIKGERGVCNQRNAIMRHFKPGDRIVEMDDDIKGLVTTTGAVRSDKSAKTVNVPNENLELILDHLWEIADREKCQLWGLYPVSNPWMLSRTYALGLAKSTAQLQGYYNPKETFTSPSLSWRTTRGFSISTARATHACAATFWQ